MQALRTDTAQKTMFSIKNFFRKCEIETMRLQAPQT